MSAFRYLVGYRPHERGQDALSLGVTLAQSFGAGLDLVFVVLHGRLLLEEEVDQVGLLDAVGVEAEALGPLAELREAEGAEVFLFVLVFGWALARTEPVPLKDPGLAECLDYHS